MTLFPHFQDRTFGNIQQKTDVSFSVDSLGWLAIGGPSVASITAKGGESALWDFADYLRFPVEVYDDKSRAVWWGYVSDLQINYGPVSFGVALDTMSNGVNVKYQINQSGTAAGTATGFTYDASGTAEYGIKQEVVSLNGAGTAQAANLQAVYLAAHRYPIPNIQPGAITGNQVTLNCKGWWSTLDWNYYANAGATVRDTTAQMGTILAGSCGQFITGTRIISTSGITNSEFRDGNDTGRAEIERLLACGNTGNLRMLATVDINRLVTIYPEPTADNNLLLSSGDIQNLDGSPVDPWVAPVGVWYRAKNILPAMAPLSKLSDASHLFIEEVNWNRGNRIASLRARNVPSPWEDILSARYVLSKIMPYVVNR